MQMDNVPGILAVDDDQAVLETYRLMLEPQGSMERIDEVDDLAMLVDTRPKQQDASEVVAEENLQLVTVESGEEAVVQVEQAVERDDPFYLALIDMRMPPGIDGAETARRIRQLDPQIYIVIVTAYSDHSTYELFRRLQYGFLYLQKPFRKEELQQVCRNFHQAWRRDRELEKKIELEKELHRQEEYSAWLSGMQEMARSVLHNMGNALSSIEYSGRVVKDVAGKLARFPEILNHFEGQLKELQDPQQKLEQIKSQHQQLLEWVEHEVAEQLQERSEQLLQVTHHVIDVLQMYHQDQHDEPRLDSVTMEQLLYDAMLVLEIYANNRRIVVEQQISPELDPLQWPRNRILQILVNLLKNAFEAIEMETERRHLAGEAGRDGEVAINVRQMDGEVVISVEDNGIGVEPARMTELFTMGKTTKSEGSGIGLHWARNQLQQFGGEITLQSEGTGQGAAVEVVLPVEISFS